MPRALCARGGRKRPGPAPFLQLFSAFSAPLREVSWLCNDHGKPLGCGFQVPDGAPVFENLPLPDEAAGFCSIPLDPIFGTPWLRVRETLLVDRIRFRRASDLARH